jgi:hypothetical protein
MSTLSECRLRVASGWRLFAAAVLFLLGTSWRRSILKKHTSILHSKNKRACRAQTESCCSRLTSFSRTAVRAPKMLLSETPNKRSSIKRKRSSTCAWVLLQQADHALPNSRVHGPFTRKCVLKEQTCVPYSTHRLGNCAQVTAYLQPANAFFVAAHSHPLKISSAIFCLSSATSAASSSGVPKSVMLARAQRG